MKRWTDEDTADTIAAGIVFLAFLGLIFICLYAIGAPQ